MLLSQAGSHLYCTFQKIRAVDLVNTNSKLLFQHHLARYTKTQNQKLVFPNVLYVYMNIWVLWTTTVQSAHDELLVESKQKRTKDCVFVCVFFLNVWMKLYNFYSSWVRVKTTWRTSTIFQVCANPKTEKMIVSRIVCTLKAVEAYRKYMRNIYIYMFRECFRVWSRERASFTRNVRESRRRNGNVQEKEIKTRMRMDLYTW